MSLDYECQAPLVEPVGVQTVYASGLSAADNIGDGNFMYTLYANQRSPSGEMERIIVDRIVMPAEGAAEAALAVLASLGTKFLRHCASCLRITCH